MLGKNPAAVALGKLGGAKGGKARAAKLSPAERKAIAKKAAAAPSKSATKWLLEKRFCYIVREVQAKRIGSPWALKFSL